MQLTKAFLDEMSCNQLLIYLLHHCTQTIHLQCGRVFLHIHMCSHFYYAVGLLPLQTKGNLLKQIAKHNYVNFKHVWFLMQIEIRGANYTGSVEGVGQGLVSVVVDQLNQNFTKGENHSVSVFAVNSIGSSTPVSALLLIPCELASQSIACVYHTDLLLFVVISSFFLSLPTCQSLQ